MIIISRTRWITLIVVFCIYYSDIAVCKRVKTNRATATLIPTTTTTTSISTATPSTTPDLYPPISNEPAFSAILISGSISASLSLTSSLFIIIWILAMMRTQKSSSSSSSTGKYPLIFALNDILFTSFNLINFLYILTSHHYPPPEFCSFLGASQFLFGGFNFMFVFLNAVYVYMSIVRRLSICLGRFQWRIIVPSIVTSSLLVIFCALMNGFGPMKYWCGISVYTRIGYVSLVVASVCYFAVLLFIVFAYSSVIVRIFKARRNILQISSLYQYNITSSNSNNSVNSNSNSSCRTTVAAVGGSVVDGNVVSTDGNVKSKNSSSSSQLFNSTISDESESDRVYNLKSPQTPNSNGVNRGVERLCMYVTMFLFQWVPLLALALAMLTTRGTANVSDWLFGCAIVFGNLGGLLNLFAFLVTSARQ